MAKNKSEILNIEIVDIDYISGIIMLQFYKDDIFCTINLDAEDAEELGLHLLEAKTKLKIYQEKK